jgi:uncharacterized protein YecE (DUF72 family)
LNTPVLNSAAEVRIGCAGWSLAREHWPAFGEEGSHLQRYASRFNAVEINSSFYRPHRPQTYTRWAQSVPEGFRFCVKVPKLISHEQRLQGCEALLDDFLAQCTELGEKLGCLLIQLPPSLQFDPELAERFFEMVRMRFSGGVAFEPRHQSWDAAEALLIRHRIARVAADPSPMSGGEVPAGWNGLHYWRLHGSPRIYHSAYGREWLSALAQRIASDPEPAWCIFDNTASGAAVGDALTLGSLLQL